MTISTSPVWRVSRVVSRIGVAASVLLLASGLVAALAGFDLSRPLLGAGIVTLGAIPAASVFVLLADNVRRRDWQFVLAAAVVIGLLAYSIVTRLR